MPHTPYGIDHAVDKELLSRKVVEWCLRQTHVGTKKKYNDDISVCSREYRRNHAAKEKKHKKRQVLQGAGWYRSSTKGIVACIHIHIHVPGSSK